MGSSSRRTRFVYYAKRLPRWLRQTPTGNYARALALGTEVRELSPAEYDALFGSLDGALSEAPEAIEREVGRGVREMAAGDAVDGAGGGCSRQFLWIPQGGCCAGAEEGLEALAHEIASEWSLSEGRKQKDGEEREKDEDKKEEKEEGQKPLIVVLPGGTGSTALFLARHLRRHASGSALVKVAVVPCVGDSGGRYLMRQMRRLDELTGGDGTGLPFVLRERPLGAPAGLELLPLLCESQGEQDALLGELPCPSRPFGEPRRELLAAWRELAEAGSGGGGLDVDLLYGARAWEVLLSWWDGLPPRDSAQIMYLHCGGLEGVATQLRRYERAGLLE